LTSPPEKLCSNSRSLRYANSNHIPDGTVDHPFGTIKSWMGSTHFQMKTLKHVGTEMALHVLAYNIKRVISILGVGGLIEAIRA